MRPRLREDFRRADEQRGFEFVRGVAPPHRGILARLEAHGRRAVHRDIPAQPGAEQGDARPERRLDAPHQRPVRDLSGVHGWGRELPTLAGKARRVAAWGWADHPRRWAQEVAAHLVQHVQPLARANRREVQRDELQQKGQPFERFAGTAAAARFVHLHDAQTQTVAIYTILNPYDPAAITGAAVDDAAILQRDWLLLDIDSSTRPAQQNATDDERAAAFARAADIKADLRAQGWPEPIDADPGNGAHLVYPMCLANTADSTALVRDVLQALAARFDTADVHVDTSVYNASRITKLYGTKTRKGPHTADRPQRRSGLLHIPEALEPVSIEALQALVDAAPEVTTPDTSTPRYDIGQILAKLTVWGTPETNGGKHHDLTVYSITCPWYKEHSNPVADRPDGTIFTVGDDGAVGFKCQHHHCADRTWADLRDLYHIAPIVLTLDANDPMPCATMTSGPRARPDGRH